MSHITQRLLPDVLRTALLEEDGNLGYQWHQFFDTLIKGLPVMNATSVTLDPASVAANSTSPEVVAFNGITTNDLIVVNKPTHTSGISVTAFASAANQATIVVANSTVGAINPPSEVYKLYSFRL